MVENTNFKRRKLFAFFVSEFILGYIFLLVFILNFLSINLLPVIVFFWLAQVGPALSFFGVINKSSWKTKFDLFAPWLLFPLAYSIYYGVGIVGNTEYQDLLYPVSLGLFMYYLGLFFVNLHPVKNRSKQGIIKRWRTISFYLGTLIFYFFSIL